ncbi:hypothetical protein [Nocardia paucivorans]|uniref:hypothetical protein n=1 Tax=Nocardia paucivorans TaxID=114259 RepID=UPI0002DB1C8D|nr:hypothetical protein [Nocardia paucivorans]
MPETIQRFPADRPRRTVMVRRAPMVFAALPPIEAAPPLVEFDPAAEDGAAFGFWTQCDGCDHPFGATDGALALAESPAAAIDYAIAECGGHVDPTDGELICGPCWTDYRAALAG